MNIFTIDGTELIKGAIIEKHTLKNGLEIKCVKLGENGRGRSLAVIPYEGKAEVGESVENVSLAFTRANKPKIIDGGDNKYYMLLRPVYGYRGGVKINIPEKIKILATGYIAQGDAGRMGGNPQYFLQAEKLEDFNGLSFTRTGRLYGDQATWEVGFVGGDIAVDYIDLLPEEEWGLI